MNVESKPILDIINDIVRKYELQPASDQTKYNLESELRQLRQLIAVKFHLSRYEFDHVQFHLDFGVDSVLKFGNLFTACLVNDRYVPLSLIENRERIEFEDSSEIYSDASMSGGWVLKRPIQISQEGVISVFEEVVPKLHPDETDQRNKIFDSIKDNLQALSDGELREYMNMFGGTKFYVLVEEKIRREKLVEQEFIKNNPGVPLEATLLEPGKTYSGHADGSFEIKTINGKLWFIPTSSSVDFSEIVKR